MAERRDPTPPPSPSSDSDSETPFPFMELTPVETATSPDSSKNDKKLQDMLSLVDHYCDTDVLSSEAIKLLCAIPDGYIPVAHQMGGHKYVNGKPGLECIHLLTQHYNCDFTNLYISCIYYVSRIFTGKEET